MKTKIILLLFIFCQIVFFACTDKFDSQGVSKTTFYAIITLKGDQWGTVTQGSAWTEPGVEATENGTPIEYVVGGDVVDTSTPGVYTITYTATNKDGFPHTEYRYVGVIAPSVRGIDLSGKYQRNAGVGGVSTVTKISDNIYTADNVGGVKTSDAGPSTTVYFFHYDTGLLNVPYQLVAGSPFYCTNATVKVGISYSWVVINPGYGTALRTFLKL